MRSSSLSADRTLYRSVGLSSAETAGDGVCAIADIGFLLCAHDTRRPCIPHGIWRIARCVFPLNASTCGASGPSVRCGVQRQILPGGVMRTVEQWLSEYGESHQNPINKRLHWICVPIIVLSLVGLLWSLPVPNAFGEISPLLNWGTLLLLAGVLYYFSMSR